MPRERNMIKRRSTVEYDFGGVPKVANTPVAEDVQRLLQALREQPDDPGVHEGYRALFGPDSTEAGDAINEHVLTRSITEALAKLTEDQRYVLRARIIDNRTLEDIGAEMECSHQWIYKIEVKALQALRKQLLPNPTSVEPIRLQVDSDTPYLSPEQIDELVVRLETVLSEAQLKHIIGVNFNKPRRLHKETIIRQFIDSLDGDQVITLYKVFVLRQVQMHESIYMDDLIKQSNTTRRNDRF